MNDLFASTRGRVLTVFACLTLILLLGLSLWQLVETRRAATLLQGLTEESADIVTRVVELEGKTLAGFVADYSPWDDMANFVARGGADKQWAETNLVAVQTTFHADALFVYGPRPARRRNTSAAAMPPPARLFIWTTPQVQSLRHSVPIPADAFARLDKTRLIHYYVDTPIGLLEVRAATIHPSNDLERRTPPRGYLFAARIWNQELVRSLEPLTGCRVRLLRGRALQGDVLPPSGLPRASEETLIRLRYHLSNLDSRTVAAFQFERNSDALSQLLQSSRYIVAAVATADALLLAVLFWTLHVYVGSPLSAVAVYLRTPSPQWLKPLQNSGIEFRRIATMLAALSQAHEERAALSAILADVSRPLRKREVLEAFAEGVRTRLAISGGVVLLPAPPPNAAPSLHAEAFWGIPSPLANQLAAAYSGEAWNAVKAQQQSPSSALQWDLLQGDKALAAAGLPAALSEWTERRIVPLTASGAVLGIAVLFQKSVPERYSDTAASANLYAALGSGVGVALENARLFEEVRESQQMLQVLSTRLVDVQEQERAHLARELHDEVGQLLTGLRLTITLAEQAQEEEQRTQWRNETRTILTDLTSRVRTMSLDLRPPQLDDFGLAAAVSWLTQRFTTRTNIEVAFWHEGVEDQRFSATIETAAYRIIQEALTNVARHSGAREARVRLWATPEALCLQVEDEGDGFVWTGRRPSPARSALKEDAAPDPTRAVGGGLGVAPPSGSGLLGMRERAELLGGRFTLVSEPGSGTAITVELPIPRPL